MPAPTTSRAIDRLERLLYVVARASGADGVALEDVALELGVDARTVISDLRELQERDLYHASGGADDFQVDIGPDRIRVWCAHRMDRPTKLSLREALALWFGLEAARLSDVDGADGPALLADRLLRHLTQLSENALSGFAAPAVSHDEGGIREALLTATADGIPCTIDYLKPTAREPEPRVIHPYRVVLAEGAWYAIAHCTTADAVRTFRLDRTLSVRFEEGRFERPSEFDPARHLDVDGGRVLDGSDVTEASVRYSPAVARWVAEQSAGEWSDDGSYLVRHQVADPGWVVRHVLQYGGDAELVEPADLREAVLAEALRIGRR